MCIEISRQNGELIEVIETSEPVARDWLSERADRYVAGIWSGDVWSRDGSGKWKHERWDYVLKGFSPSQKQQIFDAIVGYWTK